MIFVTEQTKQMLQYFSYIKNTKFNPGKTHINQIVPLKILWHLDPGRVAQILQLLFKRLRQFELAETDMNSVH